MQMTRLFRSLRYKDEGIKPKPPQMHLQRPNNTCKHQNNLLGDQNKTKPDPQNQLIYQRNRIWNNNLNLLKQASASQQQCYLNTFKHSVPTYSRMKTHNIE